MSVDKLVVQAIERPNSIRFDPLVLFALLLFRFDGPEILPSSNPHITPMGADVRHAAQMPSRFIAPAG